MKIFKYILILAVVLPAIAACGEDDYDGPKETFRGSFIDKGTGELLQTAYGDEGVRITLMEYSWSDNPIPYYMYAMPDGTFNNTKIFKADYGVTVEGAFVPIPEEIFTIKGTVEKNYEVEPLLRVEWIGEPVINPAGFVEAKVKITRGTTNPDYQLPIAQAWFYISETSHISNAQNQYNPNLSTRLRADQLVLDQEITLRTGFGSEGMSTDGSQPANLMSTFARKYFIRMGATTATSGSIRFNWTDVKEIEWQGR